MNESGKTAVLGSAASWWRNERSHRGYLGSLGGLLALAWEFVRDSLPSRRRQRYGDVDYDWDYRVDTTAATINWRDRLLGLLNSPYQPTDPALFHELLAKLKIDFREFVFIDIGSGKGRVLLLAADYPFRRVIGVELLPALHRVAEENIRKYQGPWQKCFAIEALCGDASEFRFPPDPLVVYLFNPLPVDGLRELLANLERSLQQKPRPVYVIYHNPLLEHVLAGCTWLRIQTRTPSAIIASDTSGNRAVAPADE